MPSAAKISPEKIAFPVPVVRIIVPDKEGRDLMLRRQNTGSAAGQWCLPGGKVDYGVTVEQAVRDELKEETGLDCLGARFLFYQDSLPVEPGTMHCINLYFRCRTAGDVVLNRESSEFAWIGREQLADYALVFRNGDGLARFWRSRAVGATAQKQRRALIQPESSQTKLGTSCRRSHRHAQPLPVLGQIPGRCVRLQEGPGRLREARIDYGTGPQTRHS